MRNAIVAAALLMAGSAVAQDDADTGMGTAEVPDWAMVQEVPRADWSQLGEAATTEAVAEALAGINRPFAYSGDFQAMGQAGWAEDLMQDAIQQVLVIRDNLSGNPYVRLSGFTVGIPWGVSVEFTFPEPEEEVRGASGIPQ